MKTKLITQIAFQLLLLMLFASGPIDSQAQSTTGRELVRQRYEVKTIGSYTNADFDKIPWLVLFNDALLSYQSVETLFIEKLGNRDLGDYGKLYKRWQRYKELKSYHGNGERPFQFYDDDVKSVSTHKSISRAPGAANFQYIGQTNSVFSSNNGRIERINFHPTDSNIVWASAPEGGLWRSNDGGDTWTVIDDFWEHQSVGDLIYDLNNHNIIYVATDDHDSWFNPNRGVLKSVDGGITWNIVGLLFMDAQNVHKLMLHPDGSTLLACTNQGLFSSSDGGVTWIKNNALPTDVNDVEFHPTNSNIMYASVRGNGSPNFGYFYVSTNGGTTFTQKTLSIDSEGRTTQVAVSPANPDIAMIGVYPHGSYLNTGGIIIKYTQSTDALTTVLDPSVNMGAAVGGAWDFRIELDPTNANRIFYGCVFNFQSFDGGTTFNRIPSLHADVHDFKIQTTANNKFWIADDGGLGFSRDDGATWTTIENLPVTQLNHLSSNKTGTRKTFGLQDAGIHTDMNGTWTRPIGGDGEFTQMDPTNEELYYTTIQQGISINKIIHNDENQSDVSIQIMNQSVGGGVATFHHKMVLHPTDKNTIYTLYFDIFKSTDQGQSWTNLTNGNIGNGSTALRFFYIAPSDPNTIITAYGADLLKSTDEGQTWTTLTYPGIYLTTRQCLVFDPNDADRFWVCRSNVVMQTTDGGMTWTNISGTIPVGINESSIAYQEGANDALYVAGERGLIYYKDNTLPDWVLHNQGLPHVRIRAIEVLPHINKLRISTWGRGPWEGDTYANSVMPCDPPQAPTISSQVCETTATLTISSSTPTGYSIKWFKDGSELAGETGTALNATMSGEYRAQYADGANVCDGYLSQIFHVNLYTDPTINTGQGIHFDGSDDRIVISNGSIDLRATSFTTEFWVKRDAIGSADYIIGQGWASTNMGLTIGFRSDNTFTFAFYGNDLSTTATYTDTDWHHWACVYDHSIVAPAHNRFIYRDGVLVASDRATGNYNGVGSLRIGESLSQYFGGTLDEIKIWNTARSVTQVDTDMRCVNSCRDENLVSYIPIDQGTSNGDNTALTSFNDHSTFNHAHSLEGFTLNGSASNITSGLNITVYADTDMDNFGDPATPITNLCATSNFAHNNLDCDDTNSAINPLASEVCGNSEDDDCDGNTDIEINKALDFDGTDDRVTVEPFWPHQTTFTLEAWIKTSTAGTQIMNWQGPHTGQMYISGAGLLAYGESDGVWSGWHGGPSIVDDQWHHVAIVRTPTSMQSYVDGIRRLNVSISKTLTTDRLTIGGFSSGFQSFNGVVDEVRIWEIALTEEQIRSRMNVRLDGNEANLVRYFPLDQGIVSGNNELINTAIDKTSSGAQGNLVGFTLNGANSNWVASRAYPTLYHDVDSDGYGNSTVWTCGSMSNFVDNNVDCNDMDANVNPGVFEICGNSIDDDCDGNMDLEVNRALDMTGASDYVSIPAVAHTSAFTFEAWIKVASGSPDFQIINEWNGTNRADLRLITGGVLTYRENGGGFNHGGQDLRDDQWHHIAVTHNGYSGNNVVLYIDGVVHRTFPFSTVVTATACAFGADVNGNNPFHGAFDDVRYWDSALTQAQIIQRMDARLDGDETNLVRYYRFDQGKPAMTNGQLPLLDAHAGANHGTLNNFANSGSASNWILGRSIETRYIDQDMDGYAGATIWTCGSTDATSSLNLDCQDNSNAVHPAAIDICGNGVDENCDGTADENAMALNFDGSDDQLNFTTSLGNFGTADFSIDMRFKTTASNIFLLSKRPTCGCDNLWNIQIISDGKIRWEAYEDGSCGNGSVINGNAVVNDNAWHHLAITRSNGSLSIYIDGQLDGTGTMNTDINNGAAIGIGNNPCNAHFNGDIDNLRIWDVALDPAEIDEIHDVNLPGSVPGLVANYNFNSMNATPDMDNTGVIAVADQTSNNHDGTLSNFALNGTSSNWVSNPGTTTTWYADTDNDGYGDPNNTTESCSQPANYVADSTDCDDTMNSVNPGAIEVLGNSIDDDCDNAIDEESTMRWVLQSASSTNGSCTSTTDCCTNTLCFGLEFTPATTGTLAAYTTGFLSDCVLDASPVVSNSSCVMTDNSSDIDGCASVSQTLINSSGNGGSLSVVAGVPVIIHQLCLTIPAGQTVTLVEDAVTDLSASIDLPAGGSTTEFPTYSTTNLEGNKAPVILGSLSALNTEGCTAADAPAAHTSVAQLEAAGLSISDACTSNENLIVTSSDNSTGTCPVIITRTYTIADECGLQSTTTQTINVDDNTAPAITGSLSTLNEEGCVAGDVSAAHTTVAQLEAAGLSISDACTADGSLIVSSGDNVTGTCPVVIIRTYTITDACGNASTATQTINVDDNTAPAITGSLSTLNEEGCVAGDATAAHTTIAQLEAAGLSISDACTADGSLGVSSSDNATGTCPIVITRIYTITDACGNVSTATQTINVDDNTAPAITGSLSTLNEEGCVAGDASAPHTTVAQLESAGLSISDACTADGSLGVSSSDNATGTCPIVITRTYTITDACGNISTATQTINVDDNTAPTITGSLSTLNEEGCVAGDASAAHTTVAQMEAAGLSISDACTADGSLGVSSSDNATGTCPIVITRTYTITDACGNVSTATQTINVDDNTSPAITGSLSTLNEEGCVAGDASTAHTTVAQLEAAGLSIFDACTVDGSLSVSSSDNATGTCPIVITRTYTITDACGNASTATQTINVDDNTAPVITGSLSTLNEEGCVAGDASAAHTTVAQLEAAGLLISDACTADESLTVSSSDNATGTCPVVITRTYTITDACSNASTATQTINVDDSTAPTITGSLATLNEEGCVAGDASAPHTTVTQLEVAGLSIADACSADGSLTVSSSDNVTGTCPILITRTYTITDECGNSNTATQTINVDDNTAPAISGSLSTLNEEGCATGDASAAHTTVAQLEAAGLSISDACTADGSLTVSSSDNATGTCPIVITRTYTVTDDCGNASTANQTINVDDMTNPTLTAGAIDPCYATMAQAEAAAIVATTSADNCSSVSLSASNANNCPTTITVTGTDACGNVSAVTYTTVVTNNVPPAEVGGPVSTSVTIQSLLDTMPPEVLPVIQDACGNTLTPTGLVIGGTHVTGNCDGTITYTYTYTDCAGSSIDWTYTYNLDCALMQLRIFLEGPYSTATDNMATTLNDDHLLPGMNKDSSNNLSVRLSASHTPFGQPYQGAPWNFTGNLGDQFGDATSPSAPGVVIEYPNTVVDWVLVSIRENGITPADEIYECAGWIRSDGQVSFPEVCTPTPTFSASNDYYIVVQHRNHLPVLDTAAVSNDGTHLVMDFTLQNSYAPVFRSGQKEVEPGVWAMFSANAEQSNSANVVNSVDRTIWKQLQNQLGYLPGDLNLNVSTNSQDETIWKTNQNTTTGVLLD